MGNKEGALCKVNNNKITQTFIYNEREAREVTKFYMKKISDW